MNRSHVTSRIVFTLLSIPFVALAADPKSADILPAQERQLVDALNSSTRWTAVPAFVRDIRLDATGRAWFVAPAPSDRASEVLRDTIESAASGKTSLIRGGDLLLVDRAGRFWVASDSNSKQGHLLLCHDGKSWLEPRTATGEKEIPPRTPTAGTYRGTFWDCGFEDSAGNVYFIGGAFNRTGWGVHRRTPAGEWSWHKFCEPRKSNNILLSRPEFFEQSGGRIVIYPRGRDGGNLETFARALIFDGQKWETIDPRVCGNENHYLTAIAPMPNGSIASICDQNRIWFRWPDQALGVTPEEFDKLTDELNSDEPDIRDGAGEKLVQLGRHVKPMLDKLNPDDFPPEARIRLTHIRETIDSVGGDDHDIPLLYGGRFMFRHATFVARRPDGSLQLYVEECKDLRDGKLHQQSFLLLDAKGKWRIEPIPTKQWETVGAAPQPAFRFRDSRGALWLRDAMLTHPDNSALPVAPDGFTFDRAFAEDNKGRVFVKGDRFYFFDPAQPEAKSELPLQTFTHLSMAHRPGERVAWGVKDDVWPHELIRFGGDQPMQIIPPNWKNSGIGNIQPLKGNAAIVHLWAKPVETEEEREKHPIEPQIRLWDGNVWTVGNDDNDLRDFVHQHAEKLAKLAPNRLDNAGLYGRSNYRLSSDGAGGLWFWMHFDTWDNDLDRRVAAHVLEHFDGKAWHDAWPAIGVANPIEELHWLLASAHGGKSILVHNRTGKSLYLLRHTPDGFEKVALPSLQPPPPDTPSRDFIEDSSGDLWFRTGQHPFPLAHIRPDGAEIGEPSERPLLSDPAGNLWILSGKADSLRVVMQDKEATFTLPAPSRSIAMTTSPDGRIWLLHPDALIELRADRTSATITELARHKWASPMNDFRTLFCDSANALWLQGHGHRKTRITLSAPAPSR